MDKFVALDFDGDGFVTLRDFFDAMVRSDLAAAAPHASATESWDRYALVHAEY